MSHYIVIFFFSVNWTDASLGMMTVVPYFQEVKQLEEIRLADCNPETRLITLIGKVDLISLNIYMLRL